MKRKKAIIIKDPQLLKIRNNLRMLLLRWAQKQRAQLRDEQDKIDLDEKRMSRPMTSFTTKEKEKLDEIQEKMMKIDKIVNRSICKCGACNRYDQNRIYNPVREKWYCIDCYHDLQAYYKNKKESVLFP
jgi:hypothetical protein